MVDCLSRLLCEIKKKKKKSGPVFMFVGAHEKKKKER